MRSRENFKIKKAVQTQPIKIRTDISKIYP